VRWTEWIDWVDWSVLRYLIVGALNTGFGLLVIFGCKWALGMDDIPANMVGYGCGVIFSFVLNAKWTFDYDGPKLTAFLRFVSVLLVAYLANLFTVVTAIDMGVNSYLAQALGVIPYVILGYLGSRLFAFAKPAATDEASAP